MAATKTLTEKTHCPAGHEYNEENTHHGQGRRYCRVCRRERQRGENRSGNRRYRKYVGDRCERCGFEPEERCQLDVHHRDHDHSNNDPANLGTLCANCHRLEHCGLPLAS